MHLTIALILFSSIFPSLFQAQTLAEDEEESEDYGILNTFKNLTKWAIKEENIVQLAKDRFKILSKESRMLENYIEDYLETTGKAVDTAKVPVNTKEERGRLIASSGITSYRMIYRLTKHLSELNLIYSEVVDNTLFTILTEINSLDEKAQKGSWPSGVDLSNAFQSFFHVQESIMGTNINKFAQILSPKTDPIELNAFHSAQIGLFALHEGLYDISVEWLELCRNKLLQRDFSIPLVVVENYLAMVIKAHNEALLRLPYHEINLFEEKIEIGQDPLSRVKRKTLYLEENQKIHDSNSREGDFWELCSGKNIISKFPSQGKLNCYYDTTVHPVWILGPQKIEELSHSPKIIQIHDIIGDKEIKELLSLAEDRLERSQVISDDESGIINQGRTSVGAALENVEVLNFTRKLERITGLLSGIDSESLALAEYVFGRHYSMHLDAGFEKTLYEKRIATLLIYLNDESLGGFTSFVDIGKAVPPLKGSGIFWYNLYRNGTVRSDTHHGACSIVYGHKIVIQKWFDFLPQFQTYKCSLDSNE